VGIGAWGLDLMKSFWLVKQEPSDYSWSDFVADGGTSWTGVRNFAARNNLRRMSKGDEVLFYHSGRPSSPRDESVRSATGRIRPAGELADRTGSSATPYQETRAVVGIARVTRTAYRDTTAKEGDWSAVDLAPVKPLRRPVTLREIKGERRLKQIALVRQSRLSVMPLGAAEFRIIVKMSE
jgi:predicted RNA-binding protein with PUA-like domain